MWENQVKIKSGFTLGLDWRDDRSVIAHQSSVNGPGGWLWAATSTSCVPGACTADAAGSGHVGLVLLSPHLIPSHFRGCCLAAVAHRPLFPLSAPPQASSSSAWTTSRAFSLPFMSSFLCPLKRWTAGKGQINATVSPSPCFIKTLPGHALCTTSTMGPLAVSLAVLSVQH